MTILVTGGAGYIGSHVVHDLVDRGERVVVLDNLATGFRAGVPAKTPFVIGDVGDSALVTKLISEHRVDAVMHFAASTVVPDSVADPAAYYRNNTVSSLALLDAAARGGVKHIVFSSTAAVYGNPVHQPVSEDAPPAPLSPYGASKLMTEIMLRDVAVAAGLNYVVLRYFNVAGADPSGRTGQSGRMATHLIKAAVQAALGLRDRLDVFGTDYPTSDGTCVRDYIHVCDLAAAHLAALTYLRDGRESVTLNCGYGRGFSVREVITTVKHVSGVDFPVIDGPRRPGDPAAIVADTSAIQRKLPWIAAYDDLATIVSHALTWERQLMRGAVVDRN